LTLVGFGEVSPSQIDVSLRLGQATAKARELQNMPANELGPGRLEDVARQIADRLKLDCEVLATEELRASRYLLAAVGAPLTMSAIDQIAISRAHQGPNLALVGKGSPSTAADCR
jgi:leucyl aminopeptidase